MDTSLVGSGVRTIVLAVAVPATGCVLLASVVPDFLPFASAALALGAALTAAGLGPRRRGRREGAVRLFSCAGGRTMVARSRAPTRGPPRL